MIHSFPDYYKEFSCVADRCEATCCAGWQIVVDEAALKRYKKVSGDFKQRIQEGVDFKEGVFKQKAGKRCAFLNEKNLCDMYTALGEKAFCETCRRYPRHIEEFENVREFTLSVSCPEAARILLSKTEPVTFHDIEVEAEEEEFDDFDPMLYEKLLEARTEMITLLQNRRIDISVRVAALWQFIEEFQEKMDEGTLFSEEGLYDSLTDKEHLMELRQMLEKRWEKTGQEAAFAQEKELFQLLFELEFLEDDWEAILEETLDTLYGQGVSGYAEVKNEFSAWKKEHLPHWDSMLEQLLLYFLYTYFCGSVYDEYVASKVKLSICSVFYIEEMAISRWKKNEKQLSMEEFIRIVYRYSRELEHSDENLCAMDRLLEEM